MQPLLNVLLISKCSFPVLFLLRLTPYPALFFSTAFITINIWHIYSLFACLTTKMQTSLKQGLIRFLLLGCIEEFLVCKTWLNKYLWMKWMNYSINLVTFKGKKAISLTWFVLLKNPYCFSGILYVFKNQTNYQLDIPTQN